ncbi:zinc finger protein 236-like [Liolophura sinensis]|uniref:zinc finger protein 236-like n=1 Tax=Liolophura sinensis TaxID=3198878 RepID=UPI003158C70E
MDQDHPAVTHPPGPVAEATSSLYTSFPYGLSGVSVSEPAYYADYGRKSRMCMYCGKVFTRSTTRRYHEVKCRSKRKVGDYNTNNQIPHAILSDVNFSPSSSHQSSPLDFVPPSSTPDLARNINTTMFGTSPPLPPSRPSLDMKGYDSDHGDALRKSPGHEDYRKDPEQHHDEPPVVSNGAEDIINSPITSPVSPPQVEKETLESVLGINTNNSSVPMCMTRTSPLPTFPIVSMANMASMASLANFHEQAAILRNSPPINNLGQHVLPPFSSDMLLAASNVMAAMSFPWRPEDTLERRYNISSPAMEPYRCEICGKVLQSANQLTIHKRTHMKVRPYPCRICGSRFTTLSSRRSHERTHLGEKPYFCVVCGTRFTRKYSLKLHENKHVDGPYKCSHCFKMCDTVLDLKDHLQCHTLPEKPGGEEMKSPPLVELSLPPPNTSTPTSTSTTATTSSPPREDQGQDKETMLSPKLETKDSEDEVSDSNDNSSSSDAMIDGKALSDSCGGEDGDKIQRCNQCGEEFPHAYLLKIHVKVHASKPFECPVCGKKFGYRNNMKTHVKCHFGLKPHVCHICGSRFTRASTLRRHIEKHQAQGDSSNLCFGSSPLDSQASVSVSTSNIPSALTSAISPTNTHIKTPGPIWLPPDGVASEHGENFERLPAFSTFQSLASSSSYPITPASMIALPQLAITSESPPQTQALNLSVAPSREDPQPLEEEDAKDWPKDDKDNVSDIGEDYDVGNNNNNISKLESCDRDSTSLAPRVSCDSVGVQVNTCGCTLLLGPDSSPPKLENQLIGSDSHQCRMPKNLADSSSTSSSMSQAQEEFNSHRERTLLALVQTGQLFACEFCECYFTEYAMLRIHKKMHAMGMRHPFVCSTCGEDCHDKVYFALHMSEHLK